MLRKFACLIFLLLFTSLSSFEACAGICLASHVECAESVEGQLFDNFESENEETKHLFICKKCFSSKIFLSANILLQEIDLISTLQQDNLVSLSLDTFISGIFRPPISLS